jgi:hypothetical protein
MRHALLVAFSTAVALSAQTYTLTDFGRQCGGNLTGQVVQNSAGTGLRLGVSGAAPNAVALLVMGNRAPAPITLPGSACLLLVDARGTMLTQTNALGNASFFVPVPPVVPLTVLFQVVVASPTARGRTVESTDGLRLTAR